MIRSRLRIERDCRGGKISSERRERDAGIEDACPSPPPMRQVLRYQYRLQLINSSANRLLYRR